MLLSCLICCSVFRNYLFLNPWFYDIVSACIHVLKRFFFSLNDKHPPGRRQLLFRLRHPLPGAGPAQAGSAGPAGEDGGGSGGRRLAGTAVLEQNIHAAFAPCFSGYPHRRLALVIFRPHIDSILPGEREREMVISLFLV